jgi:hypothetical protein
MEVDYAVATFACGGAYPPRMNAVPIDGERTTLRGAERLPRAAKDFSPYTVQPYFLIRSEALRHINHMLVMQAREQTTIQALSQVMLLCRCVPLMVFGRL